MRPIYKSSAAIVGCLILLIVLTPTTNRASETEPGYPMPIKEWFYPGRTIGLEFVYPKKQALEIARHAKEPAAESVDLYKLAAVRVEAISPLGAEVPTTATAENGPEVESLLPSKRSPRRWNR